MSVERLTLGRQLGPLKDVQSLVRWTLGMWIVLLAACGGSDAGPARESGQLGVSPPPTTGAAGRGTAVAGRASTTPTGAAGVTTPPPPPPASIAGMSAPPPPPPPGGAGAPAPLAGRGSMVTPPTAAGRGAAGMTAAAGMGAPAAGTGGACTMNLACKLNPPPSTGDIRQDCVDRINQFRTQCACMAPLERWTAAESCADMMAASDGMTGTAHGGFQMRVCTPGGNGQNECPGYPSEAVVISTCLQQMWNEGPPPMTPCTGDCFQKYGHFLNMTNKSMKKVACGFAKNASGKLWAVQNFSP